MTNTAALEGRHLLVYATSVKAERRIRHGLFVFESDQQFLDACRLKGLGVYWDHSVHGLVYDQIIRDLRCHLESSVHSQLHENRVTQGINYRI